MTVDEVRDLAGRMFRPVLGDRNIERIVVHEDDDWSGERSFYVDVFVVPGFSSFDFEAWGRSKFRLAEALIESREPRFAYVSIRDEQEEREEQGEADDSAL